MTFILQVIRACKSITLFDPGPLPKRPILQGFFEQNYTSPSAAISFASLAMGSYAHIQKAVVIPES